MMGLIFKTSSVCSINFFLLLYSPSPNAKAQMLNTTKMLSFTYLFIHIWLEKDSHKQIETIKYKKEKYVRNIKTFEGERKPDERLCKNI